MTGVETGIGSLSGVAVAMGAATGLVTGFAAGFDSWTVLCSASGAAGVGTTSTRSVATAAVCGAGASPAVSDGRGRAYYALGGRYEMVVGAVMYCPECGNLQVELKKLQDVNKKNRISLA